MDSLLLNIVLLNFSIRLDDHDPDLGIISILEKNVLKVRLIICNFLFIGTIAIAIAIVIVIVFGNF